MKTRTMILAGSVLILCVWKHTVAVDDHSGRSGATTLSTTNSVGMTLLPLAVDVKKGVRKYVSRFLVTNRQYAEFLADDNRIPPTIEGAEEIEGRKQLREDAKKQFLWHQKKPPEDKEEWPVVFVSQQDAEAFCVWLSKKEGRSYRLPTVNEWRGFSKGASIRLETHLQTGDEAKFSAQVSDVGCIMTPIMEWCTDTVAGYSVNRVGLAVPVGTQERRYVYVMRGALDLLELLGFRVLLTDEQ